MSSTIRFLGIELETGEGVLVPREETELLGRTALDYLAKLEPHPGMKVIDMCCGAGNLACAIAHARPDLHVWASDLTTPCVELARRNVKRHALGDRVKVVQGDLFEPLASDAALLETLKENVDVVVCNPPYISTGKLAGDSAHLLEKEPREAFDAGPYGFAIHKRVIHDALTFLKPGGWLIFEMGLGQEKQIASLFTRARGYDAPVSFVNEAGAPRVMAAQRQTSPAT